MYESDDDWEEKAPAPKRRKSTTGLQKCSLPPSPPSPPSSPVKEPSPEVPAKKYVKPWTKVIGTAVFEIYDYGKKNNNANNNNNNITKLDVYNNNNGDKDGSDKVKVKEQGHLTVTDSNDISKSSSFSPVENNNRSVVNKGNVSWSGNTLEGTRSCLDYQHDDEAADSDFSRSKTSANNTSSSSAPPRLVVGSIDTSAASFPERSDFHDNAATTVVTNGKQHRDSERQQHHQHGHHQNLQPPPTPQSPLSPSQQQQPQPKSASQHCNYCAVQNSTCDRCALHDKTTKRDACHKISPIKLSLSTESNDWYISPDNNDKDVVKETTYKDKDSIGYNNTEGAIKGQELGSLPLSPDSLTSEGEEENNKSPSLLAGSRNLTLEVPSPNQDTKGWYQSSCGSGGVSPSEDRWWRVPPKKRWLPNTGDYHGQVLVTDVTYNCVTVTFMESSTEKGFFKEYTDE